jgi:hypothetical protein
MVIGSEVIFSASRMAVSRFESAIIESVLSLSPPWESGGAEGDGGDALPLPPLLLLPSLGQPANIDDRSKIVANIAIILGITLPIVIVRTTILDQ